MIVAELIARYPSFDSRWDDATKLVWFDGFLWLIDRVFAYDERVREAAIGSCATYGMR